MQHLSLVSGTVMYRSFYLDGFRQFQERGGYIRSSIPADPGLSEPSEFQRSLVR